MKSNVIVIPSFYSGTAFEEIYKSLKIATNSLKIKIVFIGRNKGLKNELKQNALDDESFFDDQIDLLNQMTHLQKIDKILFLDFFCPGLDLLKYSFEQKNISPKLGALLHGGSFQSNDLFNWQWLTNYENAWFSTFDILYCPSVFLKLITPKDVQSKVKVFPYGLDSFSPIKSKIKKYDVIFPHRLDDDKGVNDLIEIASKLSNLRFVVTTAKSYDNTKHNSYYQYIKSNIKNIEFLFNQNNNNHKIVLGQSKIVLSCAKQENFGYSVLKAVKSGCIPVLPNNQCYPEFYDHKYLYNSNDQAAILIENCINNYDKLRDNKFIKIDNNFSFIEILEDFFS